MSDIDFPKFGDMLARARKARGMSQLQVVYRMQDEAPQLAITQSALSKLESGQNMPRWETALCLARILGFDVGVFTGEVALETPQDTAACDGGSPDDR